MAPAGGVNQEVDAKLASRAGSSFKNLGAEKQVLRLRLAQKDAPNFAQDDNVFV